MVKAPGNPVLFIVADAFRHDYLVPENTPYLCKMSEEGFYAEKLKPNYGFCERTEMFTGTRPDENGLFTAITFDKKGSAFKKAKTDIALLSLFDWKTALLRRYIRRFYRDWFKKIRRIQQPVYEIPLKLLPRLGLTEDRVDLHLSEWSDYTGVETIFDVFRSEGKKFYFDTFASLTMPMGTDEDRVKVSIRAFSEKKSDLYLVYIGDGDGTGHAFGPHSKEALAMTKRVDDRIKKITAGFFKEYPEGTLFVIGDHGMLEVKTTIDAGCLIENRAKDAGLKPFRDFDYFLDSPLVRMWFHSDKARSVFGEFFTSSEEFNEKGKVLTEEIAREMHVPPPGKGYGDIIWMAAPGTLVFPDFFHYRHVCRGMHGYDTSVSGQKGFCIAAGKNITPGKTGEIELIDVCPALCHLTGIRTPEKNQGKDFLKS